MKPMTASLMQALQNGNLNVLLYQLEKHIPAYTFNDITISEAVDITVETIKLLENIEPRIIDNVSYSKKANVVSILRTIELHASNISAHTYNIKEPAVAKWINAIITQSEALKDLVDSTRISERMLFNFDEVEMSRKYVDFEERYKLLSQRYDEIVAMKNKVTDAQEDIEGIGKDLKEKNELIQKTYAISDDLLGAINVAKKMSELSLAEIKNHETDIENKQLKINAFYSNVEEMSDKNYANEKRMNEFIELKTIEIKNDLDKYNESTKSIINENEELQERVEELLQGANAGELFQAFNLRKNQVEEGLMGWLIGIIVINIALVGLAIFFSFEIAKTDASLGAFFYVKTISAVPLILLDIFLIRQYNRKRDLAEEYAFRSAMSLSFPAYKDVVDEMQDGSDGMKFVVDTVQKIYEYPFDKQKISKKQIKTIEKYMDKGVEIAEKLKK